MRTLLLAPLASLVAAALVAVPASVSEGDDVRRSGSCSATADWRLRAEGDDQRIELRARVFGTRSNRAWTWKIKHNGSISAQGRAVTRDGYFEVRRSMVDLAGVDHCVFRAERVRTGEVCRGRIDW